MIQSSLVERHSTTLPSSTNHWSPTTIEYISSIAGGGITGALTSIISSKSVRLLEVLKTSIIIIHYRVWSSFCTADITWWNGNGVVCTDGL